MPSQSEIARYWGITQSRVSRLIKQGCPTDSLASADQWREERGARRRSGGNKAVKLGKKVERPASVGPSNTGDSLLDALNNSITVSRMAFEAVTSAMNTGDRRSMSIELAMHNKALQARFDAEKNHWEETEHRKLLVPVHEVTEIFRRGMNSILQGVKKLPQETGAAVQPAKPFSGADHPPSGNRLNHR